MVLKLELPQDLERELLSEAGRLGLPLAEYTLRVLATRHASPLHMSETPRTGAELVAFWRSHGVIGARPEISDAPAHARDIREAAERRNGGA
ncbi:MAG TPA: hypothetical protein VFX98_19305 [Longimicrobiaceae bacterium]|nr:hypothetical protein [Longimicrobiaceae bacterium]